MGQSVYINFDTENLRSARCRGLTDLRNQKFTQFVVGDSVELDLYLTGIDGALNIQDYSEIRLGIGNLDDRPESGSYEIAGSETLAYDHTASDLQTAIASTTAANVTTKLTDFVFKVQFDSAGAQTIPTIDNSALQPQSTVSVTRLVTGDATTKEVWLWRLFRDPLAFTNTFSNIENSGVRGTLSLATAGLYELIEQSSTVKTFFEVELTSTDGNVRTVLQAPVSINGEVIGHGFSGSVPSGGSMAPEATAFLQSFPNPQIQGDLTVGGDLTVDGYSDAVDSMLKASDAAGIRGAVNSPYTVFMTDDSGSGSLNNKLQIEDFTTITSSDGMQYIDVKEVSIGSNVTSIGSYAFRYGFYSGNTQSHITIPSSVTSIGSNAFDYNGNITSLTLNSGLTSIGNYAFNQCDFSTLTIPDSVTTIGDYAFGGNTSLATINCLATTAPSLGSSAFYYAPATEIHVPVGATGYGATYGGLTVVYDL